MTTIAAREQTALLHRAAAQAGLAPSVHNTQPWRFRIRPTTLEIRANRERRLQVLDPTSRQLLISCGCALLNARVAIAAERKDVLVERFPDPADHDLLARLTVADRRAAWTPLVRLEPAISRRHTNRREFFEREVPEEIQWELSNAAAQENAMLIALDTRQARNTAARLLQEADAAENDNPAYLAELREWTSDIATRRDGVTPRSYPMESLEPNDVPIRNFGIKVSGQMSPVRGSDAEQCLMVLGTVEDSPYAWLRAGEALQRLWLEATRLDYVAGVITQVIEVKRTRKQLRTELGLPCFPHLLLRIGQAAPNLATNRRPIEDLIEVVDS